jgi:dipeptidyl aminopeptidase/acylaminoacyl peptidase
MRAAMIPLRLKAPRWAWLRLVALGLGIGGCGRLAAPPSGAGGAGVTPALAVKDVPPLGSPRKLQEGVVVRAVKWGAGLTSRQIWVYLPEKPPAGKLPCVLVAPAGSTLLEGMDLADGDRVEHVPYVRAGFAVVAYSIDGHFDQAKEPQLFAQAATAFFAADAGVANARLALDYALDQVDAIDPNRVYCAGHSSAATLSLLVAENEPRIKACVAYAPATDVEKRMGPAVLKQIDAELPGTRANVVRWSPITQVADLKCPLFLFHAEDDATVKIGQSAEFAEALKKTNIRVTFVRAKKGGHYNAMIQEGIPQAIKWLRSQPEK